MTSPPVFWWPDRVNAALVGKSVDDQLNVLGAMIAEAKADKLDGYGPPQDDINKAVSRWHSIYEQWISERLPSTRKESA